MSFKSHVGPQPGAKASHTPYHQAKQVGEVRLQSALHEVRLLRGGLLGLALVTLLALAMALHGAFSGPETRWVIVQVDPRTGDVHATKLLKDVLPDDAREAIRQATVTRFITWVRRKPVDPVLFRQDWEKAYQMVREDAVRTLRAYQETSTEFSDFQRVARAVEGVTVLAESPSSYRVLWREVLTVNGVVEDEQGFVALVTLSERHVLEPEFLESNPLGLAIVSIQWAKDNAS